MNSESENFEASDETHDGSQVEPGEIMTNATRLMTESPLPWIAGAFLVGLGIGIASSCRKEQDSAQLTRALLDSLSGDIRDRFQEGNKALAGRCAPLHRKFQDLKFW